MVTHTATGAACLHLITAPLLLAELLHRAETFALPRFLVLLGTSHSPHSHFSNIMLSSPPQTCKKFRDNSPAAAQTVLVSLQNSNTRSGSLAAAAGSALVLDLGPTLSNATAERRSHDRVCTTSLNEFRLTPSPLITECVWLRCVSALRSAVRQNS